MKNIKITLPAKLKCPKCNKIWDFDISHMDNCPYCGYRSPPLHKQSSGLDEKINNIVEFLNNSVCPSCGHFLHHAGECGYHVGLCEDAKDDRTWCKCSLDDASLIKSMIYKLEMDEDKFKCPRCEMDVKRSDISTHAVSDIERPWNTGFEFCGGCPYCDENRRIVKQSQQKDAPLPPQRDSKPKAENLQGEVVGEGGTKEKS